MPLRVDLGGDDDFLWALVAASDSRLQQRIDKQYAAYKAHKQASGRRTATSTWAPAAST